MVLTFVTALRSVTGPHRESNQDSLGAGEEYVFVADGVGGHAGGDVASWALTHRLMSLLAPRGSRELDTAALRAVISQANIEIAVQARRERGLDGMSTTFTGLFCTGTVVRLAHIGDSRAYLVRDGHGRRISHDDSLVQALVDRGAITPDEAAVHPRRNVITRSFGGSPEDSAELGLIELPVRAGDRWLVASDGLTDVVPDGRLAEILDEASGPEEAADALVAEAEAAGSRDNISVGVSDVVEVDAVPTRPYRYLGAAADRPAPAVGDLTVP